MQTNISISLPKEVRSALDDLTRKEGVSADEVISEAVREYLFFHKLKLLRDRMSVKAKKLGVFSDRDVFDRVS